MKVRPKYKVGDTIAWYCDKEQRVHKGIVDFVNYAAAGNPDINYEISCLCCGEEQVVFVNECDVLPKDCWD